MDTGYLKGISSQGGSPKQVNKADFEKKVDALFMAELLKVMMAETSFAKDKTVGNYLPMALEEMAKQMSERGIGAGAQLSENMKFEKK